MSVNAIDARSDFIVALSTAGSTPSDSSFGLIGLRIPISNLLNLVTAKSEKEKIRSIKVIERRDLIDCVKGILQDVNNEKKSFEYIVLKPLGSWDRQDAVVRHASALQIQVVDGVGKGILIDSINCADSNYNISKDLKEIEVECVVVKMRGKNKLQKSNLGCFTFSLYHLKKLQKIDVFQDLTDRNVSFIKNVDGIFEIDVLDCLPEIVFPCQDANVWDHYKKQYINKYHCDEDYFVQYDEKRAKLHQQSVKIAQKLNDQSFRGKCNVIPALSDQYISPAINLINTSSDFMVLKFANGQYDNNEASSFCTVL